MSQYYYTVSSLPYLKYDSKPPLNIDSFLDICRQECTKRDLFLLQQTRLIPDCQDSPCFYLLKLWYSWEANLRVEIAFLRSRKKELSISKQYEISWSEIPEAKQIAHINFLQDSPLSAEEGLNIARWTFLDNLELNHHFDIEKLIIYKLKLLLLLRKSVFTREKGEESFKNILNTFYTELGSLESSYE